MPNRHQRNRLDPAVHSIGLPSPAGTTIVGNREVQAALFCATSIFPVSRAKLGDRRASGALPTI